MFVNVIISALCLIMSLFGLCRERISSERKEACEWSRLLIDAGIHHQG
jgi:hypothetical protein